MNGNKPLELKVGPGQVSTIVAAAIMGSIDADQRDVLVKDALAYLLTTPNYEGTSPLQKAFRNAVKVSCDEILKQMIQDDAEVQGKLRAVIRQAVEEAFSESRHGEMVKRCAESIGSVWKFRQRQADED